MLQPGVRPLAPDLENDLLDRADAGLVHVYHVGLPGVTLRVPAVHSVQVGGEQSGLVPTSTRANLHDDVLLVVRVFRDKRQLKLELRPLPTGLQFGHLLPCKLRDLLVRLLAQHRSDVVGLRVDGPHLPGEADHVPEISLLFGHLLDASVVRRHLRVGHQPVELLEPVFDCAHPLQHVRPPAHSVQFGVDCCQAARPEGPTM